MNCPRLLHFFLQNLSRYKFNSLIKAPESNVMERSRSTLILNYLPMILIVSCPFLSFIAANKDQALSVYIGRIVLIWFCLVCLSYCFCFLSCKALRRIEFRLLSSALGIIIALQFLYLPFAAYLSQLGIMQNSLKLAIWFVLNLFVTFLLLRHTNSKELAKTTIFASCVMLSFSLFDIVSNFSGNKEMTLKDSEVDGLQLQSQFRPNVYLFVLDSYVRRDVLYQLTGFENQNFLNRLIDSGFQVGEKSLSNYQTTMRSLSTTLSMDYYLPVGDRLNPSMWSDRLQGFNPVVQRFKSHGYRYIHAEAGPTIMNTRCGGGEDRCIRSPIRGGLGLSEADIKLMELTPLFVVIRKIYPHILNMDRADMKHVVKSIMQEKDGPFFLFSHILSPHTPARYKRDCSKKQNVNWADGKKDLTNPDVVEGFLIDTNCINQEVLEGISQILQNDKTDPIVIVQSDHGAALGLGSSSKIYKLSRYAILNTMRLPQLCKDLFRTDISLVNTFRLVFSCIEQAQVQFLENRHFDRSKDGTLFEIDFVNDV